MSELPIPPLAGQGPVIKSRFFPVSPQRLFQCWTSPEEIIQWFGGADCPMIRAEIDLQVGGKWRFIYANHAWFEGRYTHVETAKRLVFSWRQVKMAPAGKEMSPVSTVQLIFKHSDRGTLLELEHSGVRTDLVRQGVSKGWAESLQQLLEKVEKYDG